MTTELKTITETVVSGREKIAEMLRLNSALGRNLPWDEGSSDKRATETKTTSETFSQIPAPPTVVSQDKIPDWLKAAGLLALGGGSAAGLYSLLGDKKPEPPVVEQPVQPIDQSGSLLQYLEDEGYHQP